MNIKRLLLASLVMVNIALFAMGKAYQSQITLPQSTAAVENYSDSECYAGGPGSSQCSIRAGLVISFVSVKDDCTVTCNPDYYACCGLEGCHCIPMR